jgi:hypothetical protein
VKMGENLPWRLGLYLVSYKFSLYMAGIYLHSIGCSCGLGPSVSPNKLDIDGKEHFGTSSNGGDGGA